ncbi:hypothetical protein DWA13_20525, partial [Acinetobacter baumannii]|uniref:hypothetical protein n=1 Tax=Acinetobacter baumannii TaxID=470 RepID=UPI000E16C210
FTEAPPIGTSNIEVTYFTALSVASIPAGGVGTSQLAYNTVTLAKMADASVGTAELIDASVTNAKLAASNYAQSSSIPNVGITSTSYVAVTGSTITGLVATGRPLEFGFAPGT